MPILVLAAQLCPPGIEVRDAKNGIEGSPCQGGFLGMENLLFF